MRRTGGDAGPGTLGQLTQCLAAATAIPVHALVGGAEAQGADTADRAKLRAGCRLVHQVLTTGQRAVKRDWALGIIGSCPRLADGLPSLW